MSQVPETVRNAMSGLWEQVGDTVNLDEFMKAQGKGMGKRFFEKKTHATCRTTLSIFFADEKTVQSLFTVGETKKIEPITAMVGIPLPVIDPETSTMLQINLVLDPTTPNKFTISITGRKYGEETIVISHEGDKLVQTNTVCDKFISCTRTYRKSDSMASDDFEINYKQRLTNLQRHSALKLTK